jgi:ABC-type hemin transport system substrate-binding protein
MVGPARSIIAWLSLATALAVALGCGRTARTSKQAASAGPRIVSLSPAITHTLEALGAGGSVVGCTPWCGLAGVPTVGSLEDRNAEAILALRPNLLVRQGDQPDPALDPPLTAAGAAIRGWRLNSVADVLRCVHGLGTTLQALGEPAARSAADRIAMAHWDAVSAQVRTKAPVVFLFGTDPAAAFGAGTYLDELWQSMGGANAVTAEGYPTLGAEDLLRMQPAAVVVVTAAPIEGTLPAWLASMRGVHLLVAPELLEPSARMLVDGPAALRRFDASASAGDSK